MVGDNRSIRAYIIFSIFDSVQFEYGYLVEVHHISDNMARCLFLLEEESTGWNPVSQGDGTDTYWVLIVPFLVSVFYIYLLRQNFMQIPNELYLAAKVDGTSKFRTFIRITLPMISPMIFYLVITGFIGAFKAYSDAVAIFGTNLNAAEMNTIVGYIYDRLYGDSGGYPSFAAAAAIVLFVIVLTITCINLLIRRKHVFNG